MASVIVISMRAATAVPKCSAAASICAPRWRIAAGIRPFMRPCRRTATSIVRLRMAAARRMRATRIGRIVTMVRPCGTRSNVRRDRRAWLNSVDTSQARLITGSRHASTRRSSRSTGRVTRARKRSGLRDGYHVKST